MCYFIRINLFDSAPLLIQHAIHEQRYSLYSKRIYFMARIFSEIVYEVSFA